MSGDLKLVFAGPPGSGKTELADLVSAVTKTFQGTCKPTVCVRILEFATRIEVGGLQTNISVQIWDTSGEEKYSSTWHAIANDADGLVLVYNGFDKAHSRAIETYANSFARNLTMNVILVVANKIGAGDTKPSRPKMPKRIETVQIVVCNAKESLDEFFDQFTRFLARVHEQKLKKLEAQERALIGEMPVQEQKEEPAE
jgi:Rab-like protein 5